MLSAAAQDYVKQIYLLEQRDGRATTSGLAQAMDVSAASATAMCKKLAVSGLAEHHRYRGIALTDAGRRVALEVVRHHRLLELYLTEALGVPWDRVHEEAERLEHVLSDELEATIDRALGFPETDPHGDPIPNAQLEIRTGGAGTIADLASGQEAVVRRVPDGDPPLLRYLAQLGLVPDARFRVIERAPFAGPVTIELPTGRHALGVELAGRIEATAT